MTTYNFNSNTCNIYTQVTKIYQVLTVDNEVFTEIHRKYPTPQPNENVIKQLSLLFD